VGLKNGGGGWFTHTAPLGKVSNLCFIKRAQLVLSVHQVLEVSNSWFQSLLPPGGRMIPRASCCAILHEVTPESLVFKWEKLGLYGRRSSLREEEHQPEVFFLQHLLSNFWGPCPQEAHSLEEKIDK